VTLPSLDHENAIAGDLRCAPLHARATGRVMSLPPTRGVTRHATIGGVADAALTACTHRVVARCWPSSACPLVFLPASSPDLTLIEQAFSMLKTLVRRPAARTREARRDGTQRRLFTCHEDVP